MQVVVLNPIFYDIINYWGQVPVYDIYDIINYWWQVPFIFLNRHEILCNDDNNDVYLKKNCNMAMDYKIYLHTEPARAA
jgi:hypothetical protein